MSTHEHECWSSGPGHYECALSELRQAKAALLCIYGHVTNGNLEWPDALQLIEETCCTVMSDAERTLALCAYEEPLT